MDQEQTLVEEDNVGLPSILLGTSLALMSLILLPALAQRVGLGPTLTIALRGVLMRASNRA